MQPLAKTIMTQTDLTGNAYTDTVLIDKYKGYSAQFIYTDATDAAQEFNSKAAATKEIQGMVYTAKTAGAAGNSITVAMTAGATAGSEVVTVVGSAISVQIEDGVSTDTQVKTAIDAKVEAAALITVTGNTGAAQSTQIATALEGGVDSDINLTTNIITKTAHGLPTGLKVQLTTTGVLPTGLAAATNYFIIRLSADTYAFASSLANATAGTKIDLTAEGSGVHTVTAATLSGALKIQESNDGTNWFDVPSATATFTAAGNAIIHCADRYSGYMRGVYTHTAGAVNISCILFAKE